MDGTDAEVLIPVRHAEEIANLRAALAEIDRQTAIVAEEVYALCRKERNVLLAADALLEGNRRGLRKVLEKLVHPIPFTVQKVN